MVNENRFLKEFEISYFVADGKNQKLKTRLFFLNTLKNAYNEILELKPISIGNYKVIKY